MTLGTLLSDPAQGRLTKFLRRQYPELERLEILELTELVESWGNRSISLAADGNTKWGTGDRGVGAQAL